MIQLVGILNVTPDSFSEGGLYINSEIAIKHAEAMFAEGASMIDVGAESTRPNATKISDEEEWNRLKNVLPYLAHKYPGKVSLDTYHSVTAKRALSTLNVVINDVTGMNNRGMMDVVLEHQSVVIISHLKGNDTDAAHKNQLINDENIVKNDLLSKVNELENLGLNRTRIIVDPGIGFGKTPELNWQLLKFARLMPDYKVMIGYSRKRFLGDKRMDIATNLKAGHIAVESGASYLRVHDVAGHRQLLSI